MKLSLPEIFKNVAEAKTKEEKLTIINQYYSTSVAAVLSMLFNPEVKFNLKPGIPDNFGFNNIPTMSLERAIRSFPSFVHGSGDKLEVSWERLMKNISEDEARFAFALKDKDLDLGLTQADISEVYPSLIPSPTEIVVKKEEVKSLISEEVIVDETGVPTETEVVKEEKNTSKRRK